VDVDEFLVVDGALYLFRGSGAKELFEASEASFISGATDLWSSWFGSNCDGFYNTM
jgi:hypothetical protein